MHTDVDNTSVPVCIKVRSNLTMGNSKTRRQHKEKKKTHIVNVRIKKWWTGEGLRLSQEQE